MGMVRTVNEDAADNRSELFALADGMAAMQPEKPPAGSLYRFYSSGKIMVYRRVELCTAMREKAAAG